ncbi:MAG: hypothetical protein MK212_13425 [Saprospiraceae bacterium]|nr:hypothetical protein [Saprospiraceae bacterium]
MSTLVKFLISFLFLSACNSNETEELKIIEQEYNHALQYYQSENVDLAQKLEQYYFYNVRNHPSFKFYITAFEISTSIEKRAEKIRTYLSIQKVKLHLYDIDLENVKANIKKQQKQLLAKTFELFEKHKRTLDMNDKLCNELIKQPIQNKIQSYFQKDSLQIIGNNKEIKELDILQMQVLLEQVLYTVHNTLQGWTESNKLGYYNIRPFANLTYTQDSIQFDLFMGRYHRLNGENMHIQQAYINGVPQPIDFPYSTINLPVDTNSRDVQVFNIDAKLYDPNKDSLINFQRRYTYKHK